MTRHIQEMELIPLSEENRPNRTGRPQEGYSRPQEGYSRPREGYSRSREGYSRSQEGYSRSQEGYSRSREGYSRSREGSGSGTARTRSGGGRTASSRSAQDGGRSPGKRQPRRRRSVAARVSGALLYVLFVIGVSAILATVAWMWAGDVLALNKPELSASVTIPETIFSDTQVEEKTTGSDGVETVTQKTVSMADLDYVADLLEKNGLIQYKFLFKLFARFTHSDQDISAGTYELNTDMDYRALLLNMSRNSGTRKVIEVTIPEGYTADQIFALLAKEGVCSVGELEDMAATWDYKFDWLQGKLPLGDYHRLEGYLFPDTYKFYAGDDPKYVINKMLVNFDDKMRRYFDDIAQSGMELKDIVNIASMIERETDGTDEKKISSVIYNRLNDLQNNVGGTGGYLQIDATLVYINGGNVPTEADKAIDSRYNTYLYTGLPEGPISNPGMAALYAAMNPDSTSYYYYVLNPETKLHDFSRTLAEHQAKVANYQSNG